VQPDHVLPGGTRVLLELLPPLLLNMIWVTFVTNFSSKVAELYTDSVCTDDAGDEKCSEQEA
jgi:hypothetical protein